jgi:hypothetical protein
MSQKQMLQNQVLEEILRERANYYFSKKRTLDFWMCISPDFLKRLSILKKLKLTNFYIQQQKEILYTSQEKEYNFYSVLISSDKEFIKWIKLRLGYFENIDDKIEEGSRTSYISDGIYGVINLNKNEKISPLKSTKTFLHPHILINNYKKVLDLYYLNFSLNK